MTISCFTGGFTQTNGYLVETDRGNCLIDAPEGISQWLKQQNKSVEQVILTHQHYDHVLDAAALQRSGARLLAHSPYSQELTLETPARAWGMPINVEPFTVDQLIDPAVPLELNGLLFQVAHVPGHAVDMLTLYLEQAGVVFSGDTLFAGSVGRTDLPGGSGQQLLMGIRKHLLSLPDATVIWSGHGPKTTIARERESNPFL